MEQSSAVERKIIDAAREVFVENGYDGAKMRDIAARANINISMLHYYYRSKDNLFDIAFNQVFSRVYGRIFDMDDTSFNAMLERRKQSFIDSIIKSIEK